MLIDGEIMAQNRRTRDLRSKGQRSRLQGYKVQNHISDDPVAGVRLYCIEWPASTVNSIVPVSVFLLKIRWRPAISEASDHGKVAAH